MSNEQWAKAHYENDLKPVEKANQPIDVLATFVQLAEQRKAELGELSPEMEKCLQNGVKSIAAAQERIDAYHPQTAELAEQQGDALDHAKTLDLMRAGYHVDAAQRIAALDAGIAALAAIAERLRS